MANEQNRLINFRGIRFKTWIYFFLMTVVILLVLLTLQMGIMASYYQSQKQRDVKKISEIVVVNYKTRNSNMEYIDYVQEIQYTNDINILFFYVKNLTIDYEAKSVDGEFYSLFSLPQYGSIVLEDDTLPMPDESFFFNLDKEPQFTYISTRNEGAYVIYGTKLTDKFDGEVYVHISAKLEISDFTASVIKRQTLLVTIFCAILSIALSWFVSSMVARPVRQFSKTARRLAGGDYSVRFSGNGLSEIEDLADTLNYATTEMGKTETLRRDLLANVSHDLRTPLTMVKAYAEMIRDLSGSNPTKRDQHCQTIIDEADRLTNLVNDIQNLSKLQSGTERADKKPVNLSELCEHVLDRFTIYSETEGYIFIKKIEPNLYVMADEAKIEQVLYNLIGNAINYTGEDKTITVYVREENERVYFGVRDSGKGIPDEEINAVWERYYRAEQTNRTRVGTGLGLSIVKSILLLHGADSGIISNKGEGSTFWFSMPPITQNEDLPPQIKLKKPKKLK